MDRLYIKLSDKAKKAINNNALRAGTTKSNYLRTLGQFFDPEIYSQVQKSGLNNEIIGEQDLNFSADIHLKLSPELKEIIEKAASAGLNVSEFIRRIASDTQVFTRFDALAVDQLRRIGKNLNQVVKLFHQNGWNGDFEHVARQLIDAINQEIKSNGSLLSCHIQQ